MTFTVTFGVRNLQTITILQVLVQSQQLRREPSNIGPLAELDHWRRQLTIFTSIIEHIKSEPTVMYIHTLIRAKSKLLKVCLGLSR